MARRPRRSEAETHQLMVASAIERIARSGLKAIPEIPLEDVIVDADVSRAAVYRIWPHRADFTTDVLEELENTLRAPTVTMEMFGEVVDEAVSRESESPVRLAGLLFGLSVAAEFDLVSRSSSWSVYSSFTMLAESIDDAVRRAEILGRHAQAESAHVLRLAQVYRNICAVLGLEEVNDSALLNVAVVARTLLRAAVANQGRHSSDQIAVERRRLIWSSSALLSQAVRQRSGQTAASELLPQKELVEAILNAVTTELENSHEDSQSLD